MSEAEVLRELLINVYNKLNKIEFSDKLKLSKEGKIILDNALNSLRNEIPNDDDFWKDLSKLSEISQKEIAHEMMKMYHNDFRKPEDVTDALIKHKGNTSDRDFFPDNTWDYLKIVKEICDKLEKGKYVSVAIRAANTVPIKGNYDDQRYEQREGLRSLIYNYKK